MNYDKYDVITFEENDKVIVLETLEHEGSKYLYVDKVNEEETTTLKNFHILRVEADGYLQKETDTDILTKILPKLREKIKLESE